ncbi:TIGR02569 family protein [Streptomyces monticola]|uniref:TIGR02569 family protein n=1 Tax=Streptomyces monticola TaxID=2666263 RepID=A0ABW2JB66_9ACTN
MSVTPQQPSPPTRPVLAAFGAEGPPQPLPGGRGGTWCADGIVLKETGMLAETAWRAQTIAALPESEQFRVAPPVRNRDGTWTAYGWEAWRLVPGEPDPHRVEDIVRAGEAFHAALADLERPAFLDVRDDPWSRADRLSWGEEMPGPRAQDSRNPAVRGPAAEGDEAGHGAPAGDFELLRQLLAAREPLADDTAQLVHGDLLGNVLFAEGLPPAIIDWPPYWRPPGWASAVAVVDALCWYDASPELPARWAHIPDWRQLLVRALIYRMATVEELDREADATFRPVCDLVLSARWPRSAGSPDSPSDLPTSSPLSASHS